MQRRSGILLPLASLPSRYGIGDFGPEAYRFVNWLHAAGQHLWEVLPLLIPDNVGSPFDSPSAFALNWMLVSPDMLVREKLLSRARASVYRRRKHRIAYSRSNIEKRAIIGHAWATFQDRASSTQRRRFAHFQQQERWWLKEYALFMAIKDRHGGRPWWTWPSHLRNHELSALGTWEKRHKEEVAYFCFGQWIAHEQWQQLKRCAHQRGIRILGDLPFFVVHDSVDVWAHQRLFRMTPNGKLILRSGAPPDLLRAQGQIWGNPLYDWHNHRREFFRWWISRFSKARALYDELRLDHFRGYEAAWAVPTRSASAARGYWIRTPGDVLLRKIRAAFPRLRLIAEDLGAVTSAVYALRDRFGLIGTRVLQFGFRSARRGLHTPASYPARSVAYSGTHDMPTLREWLAKSMSDERQNVREVLPHPTPRGALQLLLASRSDTTIIPVQDVLGLGEHARLNRPGCVDTRNWTWRLERRMLTPALSRWLAWETKKYRR
ncbi:MAG: 4-alpha-glucanotransferase [bacterium]